MSHAQKVSKRAETNEASERAYLLQKLMFQLVGRAEYKSHPFEYLPTDWTVLVVGRAADSVLQMFFRRTCQNCWKGWSKSHKKLFAQKRKGIISSHTFNLSSLGQIPIITHIIKLAKNERQTNSRKDKWDGSFSECVPFAKRIRHHFSIFTQLFDIIFAHTFSFNLYKQTNFPN